MRVIVVGGFLGAGKTTLLSQAARHLASQGKRVGIITNDQAADLVDTHFLSALGIAVKEVAGGCFCCRFEDLERTANRLLTEVRPDVLLSEPVGSCTDISATVLQPMKQKWGEWAEISPFSVLADPKRLQQAFNPDQSSFPDSVRYIIRKQFEEADYLVINKVDLISQDELARLKEKIASTWGHVRVLEMSALGNRGVSEWLDAVSAVSGGGRTIIDVDYDIYASGEAELGWLNASFSLFAREETNWDEFVKELIRLIHAELASRSAEIGHLKLLVSNARGQIVANSTSVAQMPVVRGSIGAVAGMSSLIVNARARVDPKALASIVEDSLCAAAGSGISFSKLTLNSFRPAYPRPTYRLNSVIT